MGRRRRIYVDEMVLLARIAEFTKSEIALITKEADRLERQWNADRRAAGYNTWTEICHLREAAKQIKADGIEYDLKAFAGRDLTGSERIRHQEAIRRLNDAGFVVLYGDRASRVKVTKKGRNALEAKPVPVIELTNLSDSPAEAAP